MIKRTLALFLLLVALCSVCAAQIVDATVCGILENPASFNGKMVRIKGTVHAGFEEFVLFDPSCKQQVNAIWLSYPEGTKAKAGPVAFLRLQLAKNAPEAPAAAARPAVKLDDNKDFRQFDSLLSTPYKANGTCLGCFRYTVTATLVGRLDAVTLVEIKRDSPGKFASVSGFGNMNRYNARLVLQSVSDVASQEIDYSKAAAATKGESSSDSSSGDPVAAAHAAAKAFPSGNAAGQMLARSADAFGKEGEHNGVEVGFGVANTVPADDDTKGSADSPDGLLFRCTFDSDRLKGSALTDAISHVGTHIADIRGEHSDAKSHDLEYRAWQTTVFSAIGTRQKTLTLPGGYVVWNAAWPAADRPKQLDGAISEFLANWANFSK